MRRLWAPVSPSTAMTLARTSTFLGIHRSWAIVAVKSSRLSATGKARLCRLGDRLKDMFDHRSDLDRSHVRTIFDET